MASFLNSQERAFILNALNQVEQMQKQLGILRSTLEPLAAKTIKRPTKSADGKIDYTKTSVFYRMNNQ
jgi:hypothetical protein